MAPGPRRKASTSRLLAWRLAQVRNCPSAGHAARRGLGVLLVERQVKVGAQPGESGVSISAGQRAAAQGGLRDGEDLPHGLAVQGAIVVAVVEIAEANGVHAGIAQGDVELQRQRLTTELTRAGRRRIDRVCSQLVRATARRQI